jgi:hypothetical protein
MGNSITKYFYDIEKVSLTPNSMAILPKYTYKNYACMLMPNDDSETIQRKIMYSDSEENYYDYYNH